MAERDWIARYLAPLTQGEAGALRLTDDAALLSVPEGARLVVTTDSVIEGVHVLQGASPELCAKKLMRRNLSDLAAMGATPWRYFLNLHWGARLRDPATPEQWIEAFTQEMAREQGTFGMVLAGGDTTRGEGPIHLTLTCLGAVQGKALLRSTAQVGDDVYVSGTIGDAALGLALLQGRATTGDAAHAAFLIDRYHVPQPRLALGAALRGAAHAAIDISDGLLLDASRVAEASGVALHLRAPRIPLSKAAEHMLRHGHPHGTSLTTLLNGGDDYELLFTAPPSARELLARLPHPLTLIGEVRSGQGVHLLDAQGAPMPMPMLGWEYEFGPCV